MTSELKVPAYQVKLTLRDVKPPVWRRLVLPGQWHLDQVHDAIQVAMGWENAHLHEFQVGEERYGQPSPEWDNDVHSETTARLHEVLSGLGDRLSYWYDFGDDWYHDLIVEELAEPVSTARCLAGRGACPPEDSGGPWEYAEMLAALADPKHESYATYAEWIGDFDPKAFDQAATDTLLSQLG